MAAYSYLECIDLSQFQDALKKLRLIDDTIIYALNTQIPTESFKSQKVPCKELYDQLENNYKARDDSFSRCLEYSRKKVTELKSQRDKDPNNPTVVKDLRKEQNKIRFIETELGADEVIRARTKKVFYERCRAHYLPENFNL